MNLNQQVQLYYQLETAVLVSPHSLRKRIAHGSADYILVDVRSREEYERAHIVGAWNVPAYSNPDTAAYHEHQRILEKFQQLPKNRQIILYCYSKACMTGKKVGALLAENGIVALHLGIGWNEWRHNWKSWNHEHEWETARVEDYIVAGSEPGEFIAKDGPKGSAAAQSSDFTCEC